MSHDKSITWSKIYMALRMGASHCKSIPCPVWCPWVFCRWRHNVLNLSRDFPWPLHWGIMQIFRWELLVVCHHPDKSCDHKHCDSGDKFLICYLTSCEHIFKGLYKFTEGNPSWWVSTLPCLATIGLAQVKT